jgi:hypothetical protein
MLVKSRGEASAEGRRDWREERSEHLGFVTIEEVSMGMGLRRTRERHIVLW